MDTTQAQAIGVLALVFFVYQFVLALIDSFGGE